MPRILLLFAVLASAACARSNSATEPSVRLIPAPKLVMPHEVDCNSPAFKVDGMLYLFNSAGHPFRSSGRSISEMGAAQRCGYDNKTAGGRWIEAVWPDETGRIYGWYHFEPTGIVPGTTLTAPKIGAVRSDDKGLTWHDLGIVLEARPGTLKPQAQNGYFAGGHGDFSVMLDPSRQWLCFFYGNYAGDLSEQGVAVARMRWSDRNAPAGKVLKWHRGSFSEAGLGGRLTPVFPTAVAWERADCDSFWGPSVHWNTHLNCYVMLLNRARGKGWVQEGIYVSFSADLHDPLSWTAPRKILNGGQWYPQVMGLGTGENCTDKLAGRVARFFMKGVSEYEIIFSRQDAATQPSGR